MTIPTNITTEPETDHSWELLESDYICSDMDGIDDELAELSQEQWNADADKAESQAV